jgi:hypothetical protein
LLLKPTQVEKGGSGQCIDKDVKVAGLPIEAAKDGAEDAWVAGTESRNQFAYGLALLL